MIKVSDYIVRFLRDRHVDTVFGYSGGAITHLMDSMNRSPDVKFVQCYHEQTAAIAAEGYAWRSNNIGVAVATSGPGATNLVTGIADAYFDSVPTIFITGQVNTYEYRGDKPIRQQGFQETDIVSIVRPITKHAAMVMDGTRVAFELEKAYRIAKEGRQGPVLLDIPMNVQREMVDESKLERYCAEDGQTKDRVKYLGEFSRERLRESIAGSSRPMILLGGGVLLSNARTSVRRLAVELNMPVVVSLLGKGAFPEDDELFVGMIGSYGNRCANMALANSDLVIALGTRLDTRQTGTKLASFVRSGRVIRVDIDENEILHHRLSNVDGIVADIKDFVDDVMGTTTGAPRPQWSNFVRNLKEKYNQREEIARSVSNRLPYSVMNILNHYASNDQTYTVDIGQNQMFAAQMLILKDSQRWKTSGGLAPMGFALPAAIGASFAAGKSGEIFAITGDGGLQMSLQSLMLLPQYALPIKVVLLNNRSLGMITQFQDLYFDSRKEGTTRESGYLVPNFAHVAEACGLRYHVVKGAGFEDEKSLGCIMKKQGPALIEFEVGESTVVYPKLEVNMPIEDISPRLSREELSKSMLIDVLRDD